MYNIIQAQIVWFVDIGRMSQVGNTEIVHYSIEVTY